MPRAKQHFLFAAGVGLAANLLKQTIQMQLDPVRPFDWGELTAYGLVGGVIGLIPDLLEPATHPRHRGVFHSVSCGAALWYGTHGPHSEAWDRESRYAARSLCWCYLSHLGADALTPRSIRLL